MSIHGNPFSAPRVGSDYPNPAEVPTVPAYGDTPDGQLLAYNREAKVREVVPNARSALQPSAVLVSGTQGTSPADMRVLCSRGVGA
jgi:hypothetical protein